MKKRKTLSKRVRALVLSRDNNKCRMCGRGPKEVPLHVDHIFPHSMGGTDDLDNLTTLCRDCNIGKSDLLLKSILKQKIQGSDFAPIGKVELFVKYNLLTTGEGKEHKYQLVIRVLNSSSKSILYPQLEIQLPTACVFVTSTRCKTTSNGGLSRLFFSKLDVDKIHPGFTGLLMETPNVGLHYKVDGNIYWNKKLMDSQFEVVLYGKDFQPVSFKRKFSQMQCF